jgi:hypothetical protein
LRNTKNQSVQNYENAEYANYYTFCAKIMDEQPYKIKHEPANFAMKTDPTKNKHGGNAQSNAAFNSIYAKLTLRQEQVLASIKVKGSTGRTCREIAERHGRGMNAISGRITELKAMGKIKQCGTRDGCAIWVLTDSSAEPPSDTLEKLRQAWHKADREDRQAIKITVEALKRDDPSEREVVQRRIEAHLKP